MYDKNKDHLIEQVQIEYDKIDVRWLRLHYRTFAGLVLFGLLIECIIGASWFASGHVEISFSKYVVKYIASPILVNSCILLCGLFVMRSPRIQQTNKVYLISMLLVAVCFVFFTVHIIFDSLYLIFMVPVLLTIVYNNYTLTTLTGIISIVLKTISELFIAWDPDKINPLDSKYGVSNLIISTFILMAFVFVCVVVIRFEKEKNAASIQKEIEYYQTQQKLMIDELTQVFNRKALRHAFQEMEDDATEKDYIFVMIDIDNFKVLNDTFGHDIGDECLKEFADILKNRCGNNAMPFRFGGDEFCILFKNMTLQSVLNICKHIQRDLKNSDVSGGCMAMTASFGAARYEKNMTATQLLKYSDSSLYRAKAIKDTIYVFKNKEPEKS